MLPFGDRPRWFLSSLPPSCIDPSETDSVSSFNHAHGEYAEDQHFGTLCSGETEKSGLFGGVLDSSDSSFVEFLMVAQLSRNGGHGWA